MPKCPKKPATRPEPRCTEWLEEKGTLCWNRAERRLPGHGNYACRLCYSRLASAALRRLRAAELNLETLAGCRRL